MLDARAREALKGVYDVTGRTLARAGFTANSLTALGVAVTALAAWRFVYGAFVAGGFVLLAGGFLDFCDGAVAKARGTASTFGAFLDSVTDRLSDALVFGALSWFGFRSSDLAFAGAALVALILAQLTSYVRAKAESLGYECKVGILERAERVILLCIGLLFGFVEPMLWVINVLAVVTVAQRLVHVSKQARAPA